MSRTTITIETEYWARKAGAMLHITYHLYNEQGIIVLTSGSSSMAHEVGRYRSTCRICDSAGYVAENGLADERSGEKASKENRNGTTRNACEHETPDVSRL